jgi:hypothetical protein
VGAGAAAGRGAGATRGGAGAGATSTGGSSGSGAGAAATGVVSVSSSVKRVDASAGSSSGASCFVDLPIATPISKVPTTVIEPSANFPRPLTRESYPLGAQEQASHGPDSRRWYALAMRLAHCAALMLLVGCGKAAPGGGAHACTEIGCVDQFTATLARADGTLPSGAQKLTVTADGATTTCSFTLPPASPSGGGVDCPSGFQLFVLPAQSCASTNNGTVATQTCTPLAGQFSEELTILGTPATVHVMQMSNGATVIDATVAPLYKVTQPNGPGCDPICSQGGGALVLSGM